MYEVKIEYNPYRMVTELTVNGEKPRHDSALAHTVTDGKRLQEWIGELPKMLREECSDDSFQVQFFGMALDYDDVKEAFEQAKQKGTIRTYDLSFMEAPANEEAKEKIREIMQELHDSNIEAFRSEKLLKAFERIYSGSFPVNVIATMSSGKSTLINSLLGRELMPAANKATTAVITCILDNDDPNSNFTAQAKGEGNSTIEEINNLSLEIMRRLNSNKYVETINVQGNIPFLDAKGIRLELIDTPGPNNARDDAHKQKTYNAISNGSNNLILYVLNGQQLEIQDDYNLLSYVSEQIKKGGKIARDRFLFVINKMDSYESHEDIRKVVKDAKDYLARFGISDPQIFPCSAITALEIRTVLKDYSWEELKKRLVDDDEDAPVELFKAHEHCLTMKRNERLHLEQYSTLPPSMQKELSERLQSALDRKDVKEQALIHSGIPSIEAAIRAYVKKYAATKMIKDLIETFEDVVSSETSLARLNETIATNEAAAAEFKQRAERLRTLIANGTLDQGYKQQIMEITSVDELKKNGDAKIATLMAKCNTYLASKYPQEQLDDREEAMNLINSYTKMASQLIPEYQADMAQAIDTVARERCKGILLAYQETLDKIDKGSNATELDFSTFDLVKGMLANMQNSFEQTFSSDYSISSSKHAEKKVEIINRERKQVGEKTERRNTGRKERVVIGEETVQVGTRTVKNPDKKWWQFWKKGSIEEAVFDTRPIYEERVIYETVVLPVFDIVETKTEKTVFSVNELTIQLQEEVSKKIHEQLKNILAAAQKGLVGLRNQFIDKFEEINEYIKDMTLEMQKIAENAKANEDTLALNRSMLAWLDDIQKQLHDILDLRGGSE